MIHHWSLQKEQEFLKCHPVHDEPKLSYHSQKMQNNIQTILHIRWHLGVISAQQDIYLQSTSKATGSIRLWQQWILQTCGTGGLCCQDLGTWFDTRSCILMRISFCVQLCSDLSTCGRVRQGDVILSSQFSLTLWLWSSLPNSSLSSSCSCTCCTMSHLVYWKRTETYILEKLDIERSDIYMYDENFQILNHLNVVETHQSYLGRKGATRENSGVHDHKWPMHSSMCSRWKILYAKCYLLSSGLADQQEVGSSVEKSWMMKRLPR